MNPSRYILSLAVALQALSCAVSVGNPGEPNGKLASLTGLIINMEDHQPLKSQVRLEEYDSGTTSETGTDGAGNYAFESLRAGLYTVRIGPSFAYQIPVSQDTRFDIFLPTPAAPGKPRALILEESVCVLWEDRSGLEAGFEVHGAFEATVPANTVGVVHPKGSVIDGSEVVMSAINEYGASATAAAVLRIPESLQNAADFDDTERCLAATLDAKGIGYIP